MARRAYAELALDGLFELADGDASHTSMIALMSMIAILRSELRGQIAEGNCPKCKQHYEFWRS
jgi:hypothetical protein